MEKKVANSTKKTQGYTLIELISVLAIMAILGTMLMSMLDIGVNLYRTADTAMENQNNARIAIAYISVKIRQHDVATNISTGNGISVVNNVLNINDSNSPENPFRIYFDINTKTLRQQSGNPAVDLEIIDLSSFTICYKDNNPNIIEFIAQDGLVELTQDIYLRSSS